MSVLFSTKTLVAGNYHLLFLKLSVYIFMLNKTIVLFHHFVSLFNLFVSILMQSYVNSSLHVSTIYTLIIPQGKEFESLQIVQLQASSTLTSP